MANGVKNKLVTYGQLFAAKLCKGLQRVQKQLVCISFWLPQGKADTL